MNLILYFIFCWFGCVLLVLVLVLVLVVCVSSCGFNLQGYVFDVDSLYSECILVDIDLSVIGFLVQDWWKVLGDVQLDVLVVEGLVGYLSLDVVDVCLCQVQVQVGIVCVDELLSLLVFGGYIGLCLFELMVGSEIGGYYVGSSQVVFDFSYGVDLWGGKCVVWEVVVDGVYVVIVEVQVVCLNLFIGIIQVYVDLVYVWQFNDVVEEELSCLQKLFELICQCCCVGIDSDLQVCQVEVCVLVVQQQVQVVQQCIDVVCIVLVVLVGKGLDCGLLIQCSWLLNLVVLQLLGVLFSELFGCCFDIVVVCWCVEVVDKQIKVVKIKFYLSFNLIVLVGVVVLNVGDLLKSSFIFVYIGFVLSLLIFEGGKLCVNLVNIDVQYDLVVVNYNQIVFDVLCDVVDQVNVVCLLVQQVQLQQQVVDIVCVVFDLVQQCYCVGIGSYLDVLIVQFILLQLQQQLVGLQLQQVQFLVCLSKVLGGGFQFIDVDCVLIVFYFDFLYF